MNEYDDDDELLNFYERLGEDAYVDEDPPVEDDVEFEDDFDRRAHELNRKPFSGIKKVSPLELRRGPWSGNNQLGSELEFAPDVNNVQTILKLDEWGMPQVWTVMLGTSYTGDVTDDLFGFGVEALVSVGCGGITQEFICDWVEGTTFQVPMNAINVQARYTIAQNALIPPDLRLKVNVARGGLTTRGPTSTVRDPDLLNLDLPAGGFKLFQIPKFAHRMQVVSATDPLSTYAAANILTFRTGVGLSVDTARFNGDTLLQFPDGVPIPNATRYARFANNSGVDLVNFAMIFYLAL